MVSYIFFSSLQAENKLFVKHDSAGQIGTSMASINRTSKSNAAKDAHNHINEYSEFHSREVEAHICAAFMEQMNMDELDGNKRINLMLNIITYLLSVFPFFTKHCSF